MNDASTRSEARADILVSSRSFSEYMAFFDLNQGDLPPRILDCSAGASSFVAEAHAVGVDAFACDPVYGLDSNALLARLNSGLPRGNAMVDANAERFNFDWYGTAEHRSEMRQRALAVFRQHRTSHPERYVAAALPQLPFADGSFNLALCSHLLFTWATHLDEAWHLAAVVELCRVAAEVRLFPLVLQGAGQPVEFLPRLRTQLHEEFGISSEVAVVPYEFQVGANQMLKLTST